MASDYQIVGTLADIDGEPVEVGALRDLVVVAVGETGEMHLNARAQEEFAQLYVAACHQAKANAEAVARAAMPGAAG